MDNFLTLADKHGIKTMFVMFDDCWNENAKLGPQPDPIPGIHNSQWVRDPNNLDHTDTSLYTLFEEYFLTVMEHFKDDDRIYMWDIYNEPGNGNRQVSSLPLLKKAFEWAFLANTSQPVTSAPWDHFNKLMDPVTNY